MKSTQKYIRTSPRKLRLVADSVRSLTVQEALAYLKFMSKRAGEPLYKVVRAAAASAKSQAGLEPQNLVFKKLDIGDGPTLKRWQAVSRGGAHSIAKRTAHVTVELVVKGNHGTKS